MVLKFLYPLTGRTRVAFYVVGTIAIVTSATCLASALNNLRGQFWPKTNATVISIIPDPESSIRERIIYRYKVGDKRYICPITVPKAGQSFKKGDKIEIVYNPRSPKESSYKEETGGPFSILYACLSSLFLVAGASVIAIAKRGKNSK